jgi:cardiolipin synthase
LSLVPRSPITAERMFRVVRRTLLAVLGVQLALAVGMTLVDSYRRRGNRPRPFPSRRASAVPDDRGARSRSATAR